NALVAVPPHGGDLAAEVTLDGTLDRFVFRNEESSFTVARMELASGGLATVVGELVGITEGLPLRLRGQWVDDKKFGRPFRIASYQLRTPETLIGIERFLGSGVIPGIGPELARRLVAHFGMDTLEIIDRQPERLVEVSGVGPGRAARLAAAFVEQRHVQDVM